MQDGVRSLFSPALTYVAAKFSLHFRSAHGPFCEPRGVVHLTHNPLTIYEDRCNARWYRSSHARRERGVFPHLDFSHEGEDSRIAKFLRCEAFISDVAVEHRSCRDVGKAMVSGLSGFGGPFFRFASGPLIAPACRRDLDR